LAHWILLSSTAQLGYAKIALAQLLRVFFIQKSLAPGLFHAAQRVGLPIEFSSSSSA
jgi:hypothetical protein